jgi:PleD family two-component response regulator
VTEYRRDEKVADTIARADGEMYEAKESGRNRVSLEGLTAQAIAV